jgi:hypothetical protein
MIKIRVWPAARPMIFLMRSGSQSKVSILLDVHSPLLFVVVVFLSLEAMMEKSV